MNGFVIKKEQIAKKLQKKVQIYLGSCKGFREYKICANRHTEVIWGVYWKFRKNWGVDAIYN